MDAMEEKGLLLKTECRTGSSIAQRSTIAIFHKNNTSSGWEYFVSGSEREAKISPTITQAPGNNTGNSNVSIEQGQASFYVYDHLEEQILFAKTEVWSERPTNRRNTRVTYTPIYRDGTTNLLNKVNTVTDYFPYGKVLREFVDGEAERYLTTQHERDEETGLDYRGARYYDNDIGRFLSLDPKANIYPGFSDYCYVAGFVLIAVDPETKEETVYHPNSTVINENTSEFVKTVIATLDEIINRGWDDQYGIITRLANAPADEFLNFIEYDDNWAVGLGSVGATNWNPHNGLSQTLDDGSTIKNSPAHSLFHELAHRYYELEDPYFEYANEPSRNRPAQEFEDYKKASKYKAGKFHQLSDKWILTVVDKSVDEPIRPNHGLNGVGGTKESYYANDAFSLQGPTYSEIIKILGSIRY